MLVCDGWALSGVVKLSGLVGTASAEGIGLRMELVVKVISPGWTLMFG